MPKAALIQSQELSGRPAALSGQPIEDEEPVLRRFREEPIPRDARFALRAEAYALQLAHAHDKMLSLSNSRTRILSHQVESTHRIVNALEPRFILADEVGLGKTIEAGLVIKELICRHAYRRVLIIAPASLLVQWQNEMASKFNEDFAILDRRAMRRGGRSGGAPLNPWESFGKVICSLDFIKAAAHRKQLAQSRWDIVVVDEAHRLRRDSLRSTLSYNVAELLSANTRALLLLTATPFRGKLEELYYLVRLVDKNLLGPAQTFFNEYCIGDPDMAPLRSKLSSAIIRRTKKDVGGFTRRFAKTVRFELYPDERKLYDATTRYVVEEYNRAMAGENRAVGFVMTVFQKLLDSSSLALASALRNRRDHLAASIAQGAGLTASRRPHPDALDIDDIEEVSDIMAAREDGSARATGEEIAVLDGLIALADSIERNKKGEKLVSLLKKLRRQGEKRFVIFTQFRTTQEYLRKLLGEFRVQVFNGSMSREEKEGAVAGFRDGAGVLISTEAGGEGRNLQFCNILINYDLPWSPLKIEQRIGRIHRFGQERDVFIYNFSTRNTVAERVLEVLTRKIRLFEESIGVPDVLLGEMEDELRLNSLFAEMMSGRRSARSLMEEVDSRIETARRNYEKLGELTISRRFDFNYDEYYAVTMKERRFSNDRIEDFVKRLRGVDGIVSQFIGGKVGRTRLYNVHARAGEGEAARPGSFDSQTALDDERLEFLAFGHPAIDAIFAHCRSDAFGGLTGVKRISHGAGFLGMVVYYLACFSSLATVREIFAVAVDPSGEKSEAELALIEDKALQQAGSDIGAGMVPADEVREMQAHAAEYLLKARLRLEKKLFERIARHERELSLSLDPEMDKIACATDARLKELHEQLERQVCHGKWFGKDMRSAIARTRNEISRVESERRRLCDRYAKALRMDLGLRCLGAGILIALPEL